MCILRNDAFFVMYFLAALQLFKLFNPQRSKYQNTKVRHTYEFLSLSLPP